MKYCCLLFGALDQQEMQKRQFDRLWTENDVTYFVEPAEFKKYEPEHRPILQQALKYAENKSAILTFATLKDLFQTKKQALSFLSDEVELRKLSILILDDPSVTAETVRSIALYQVRNSEVISSRSKEALKKIKQKLEAGEVHISKTGREVNKFGVHEKLGDAGKAGNAANAELAKKRDQDYWPLIESLRERGLGYQSIANHLTNARVPPPAARARHKRDTTLKWYASTVRNIELRMKKYIESN